jgi:hypothetical protein
MSATLRMSRETFGIELRRGRFEIWVDGRSADSIDYGKTIEVPVEPGHHTVQVRAGRYSSRELPFDVTDGDGVDFSCSGAIFWPRWLLSFVRPDLGILLKHR